MSGSSDPWTISSVATDRIVIAYTAGNPPAFAAGQLVCNLVPTKENEIFYRRVLSVSNDVATSRLTLMTEDAVLTDFFSQGGVSFSPDSVVYPTAPDGTFVRALGVSGDVTFPRVGYDLSGTQFALSIDGYSTAVPGQATQSQGTISGFLNVTATEWYWWLTPRLRVSLETQFGKLKSFEAVASGQISTGFQLDVSVGISAEKEWTIFDLPAPSEPKTVVYLGAVGIIPVYGTLGFDFSIKASAKGQEAMSFSCAYRQEINANFGLDYTKDTGVEWVHSFQASAPDIVPPSLAMSGELGFKVTLEPRLEFLV
jgi:hypothetical protein